MIRIEIKNQGRNGDYPIVIGAGAVSLLKDLVSSYSKVGILFDSNLENLWGKKFHALIPRADVFVVAAGESSKTVDEARLIWEQLVENRFDRGSILINVGGGMVGDLGGFAASTFMRGIDFVQVPTSLLAQVDASVGGKTAVNAAGVKNLVGTFNQPKHVIIDPSLLSTLPEREFRSGLAEVVKHALIRDKDYLKLLSPGLGSGDAEALTVIVERSCRIKSEIVSQDPYEKGIRKLLNFGHTVGHAVEMMCKDLLHGEAVSVGMVAEAHIANQQGKISSKDLSEIEAKLKDLKLPIRSANLDSEKIRALISSDKKGHSGTIKWTLLESIGRGSFDNEVSESQLAQALEYLQG